MRLPLLQLADLLRILLGYLAQKYPLPVGGLDGLAELPNHVVDSLVEAGHAFGLLGAQSSEALSGLARPRRPLLRTAAGARGSARVRGVLEHRPDKRGRRVATGPGGRPAGRAPRDFHPHQGVLLRSEGFQLAHPH